MVTAVVESPLRQRQRQQRLRSPLAGGDGVGVGGDDDDLEVRHLRPAKRATGSSGGGMRGRSAPPEIVIPNGNGGIGVGGGGRGYTSLRDIMSSPKDTTTISPDDGNNEASGAGGGGGSGVVVGIGIGTAADVHMIRHPLVKHAAYAYLQLTPSAREAEARRRLMLQRRRGGGPLCRIFLGCFEFLGALFGCAGD